MSIAPIAARRGTDTKAGERVIRSSTSRATCFRVGGLSVDVLTSTASIEQEWRELEKTGISTIYQSYDWLDAWRTSAMDAYREVPFIVIGRDRAGALSFIWPFAVVRRLGVSVLTWLASPINSYNFGIFAPQSEALEPAVAREILLRAITAGSGIRAIDLKAQPASWEGHDNPFAAVAAAPTGDFARAIRLERDFNRLFEGIVSTQRRQSVRRKQRKLSEHDVSYELIVDSAGRRKFVDGLMAQKIAQLEKLRSPCIFANPPVAAFLRNISLSNTESFSTSLHAMIVDAEVISMRWNFIFKDRVYSFNHICSETSHRSLSPGLLHAIHCISLKCKQGKTHFDFGPGPGDHKDFWRPEDTPLVDTRLALGAIGWLPLAPGAIRAAAKVQARAHPAALAIIRNARYHARGLLDGFRGTAARDSAFNTPNEE